MKPSYSVRQKRTSTTPPPNSCSSAIRAWAKRAWAGGWRTASSRNMPPRTVSSSGPSRTRSQAQGRHRLRSRAVGSGGSARLPPNPLHLSGKRRRRAGAVRPKQPPGSAQGRAVLAGAAQGQGATSAHGAGRRARGSRRARALTAGTRSVLPALRHHKAAISAPAP